jgi:hypothetical protein
MATAEVRCPVDHVSMLTAFCAECGRRNAVAKEPGEIREMRRSLKGIKPADGGNGIGALLCLIVVDTALAWSLGELSDDALLRLVKPAFGGRPEETAR